jgi:serine/threonine protein kinase
LLDFGNTVIRIKLIGTIMAGSLHQPGDVIVDATKQPPSDRYRIINILGKGNSGITYAAEDIRQPRIIVAIKVISVRQTQDWKMLALFEREAKVLEKLQHQGIPRYLNYFHIDTQSDHRFYIVQELVKGQSLATWVEQGWHSDETTLKKIARQILAILVYLQRLDPPIIHRDIKPQNIIRHEDGSLYLVDFGAVRDTHHSTLMRGSTVVGTYGYGYMAPEQFLGQAVPATDLYGFDSPITSRITSERLICGFSRSHSSFRCFCRLVRETFRT